MTFAQNTQRKLEHVASKIEHVNPTASARLMRLSSAIGRAPDSMPEAWAATNVQQMIDVHAVAGRDGDGARGVSDAHRFGPERSHALPLWWNPMGRQFP